jgi:hypothetical protein
MFIRHAEKPGDGENGVTPDNIFDKESLTLRGWQRAGALIGLFIAQPKMKPTAIFASAIGPRQR